MDQYLEDEMYSEAMTAREQGWDDPIGAFNARQRIMQAQQAEATKDGDTERANHLAYLMATDEP